MWGGQYSCLPLSVDLCQPPMGLRVTVMGVGNSTWVLVGCIGRGVHVPPSPRAPFSFCRYSHLLLIGESFGRHQL